MFVQDTFALLESTQGFDKNLGVLTLFLRYVVLIGDFLGSQVLFDLTSRQFLGYPVSGSRQGTEKVS